VSENGGGFSFSRLPFLPKWHHSLTLRSPSPNVHHSSRFFFLSLLLYSAVHSRVNSVDCRRIERATLIVIAFHSFTEMKSPKSCKL
jgi:hypothetical protein